MYRNGESYPPHRICQAAVKIHIHLLTVGDIDRAARIEPGHIEALARAVAVESLDTVARRLQSRHGIVIGPRLPGVGIRAVDIGDSERNIVRGKKIRNNAGDCLARGRDDLGICRDNRTYSSGAPQVGRCVVRATCQQRQRQHEKTLQYIGYDCFTLHYCVPVRKAGHHLPKYSVKLV